MPILEDEGLLRWGFLEERAEPCAVVSDRMELVYLNGPARALVSEGWFGRRCFEVLPTVNDICAFHCPTVAAVHHSDEILYCEETLSAPDGAIQELGVAVIPLLGISGDEARAVLLFCPKSAAPEKELLATARKLRGELRTRFQHHG